ncbi:DegV family protein [Alkalibacillus salilacus]|uniref:DegV family protein with EDD domain n=1 Tax=Alkalibacillus salilacus TaxID=284582 RepID=A0ABT9VFM8_9BACI|nr:DegV family protein [Alkalibacillus salilacus]MDQ0159665.1 DegV family protein with EDD domain [Alkalibacillus salilacus]
MKIAVLTDSTSYIPQEERDKWNIFMVPLSVTFEQETYRELIDITTSEFYNKVREAKELPKTSQPAVGDFVSIFEEIAQDYDAVISVHLSSGISGTYQAAMSAGDMVDNLEVYPFDSEISCMVQGFYALEAAKMTHEGAPVDAIMERLHEMKNSSRAYFMVDDLSHLARGGRLTGAQAMVGSLLQVKPLLHFEDTKIVPFEKIRTSKKAYKRMENLLAEDAKNAEQLRAVVIHAEREELAQNWMDELDSKFPNVEFSLSYFGPVIGTHLGEGGIGLGWYRVN